MSKAQRSVFVKILLVILGFCVVACIAADIYQRYCSLEAQPGCTFEPQTEAMIIQPGDKAFLTVWQWDCLIGLAGYYLCYEVPEFDIDGLPHGSKAELVEWDGCHGACMSIATQSTTPAGEYELAIRLKDAGGPSERITLEIVAP